MSDTVVENGNGHAPSDVISKGRTFFTSKGVALDLTGISPILIAKLQSVGEMPAVPTREIPLDFGDGEVQLEELTENDLQDDEERAKWKEYKAKRDAVLTKRNTGFMKAIFAKGVSLDLSKIEEWKSEMAYFEVEVPTHPIDQKIEYIQTEAIGHTDDIAEIMAGVLAESGIPEEELKNVRSMFRRPVRREPVGELVDSQGEMDVESDVHGDESGEGVGSLAAIEMVRSE